MEGLTWEELERLGVTWEELERLGITWDEMESGEARTKILESRGHPL